MTALQLSSPAFAEGEPIPDKYGYTERNVNPPLELEEIPDEAAKLTLMVDDPDAVEPAGKVWDHWVVWDIDPGTTTIPEDWTAADATEGQNDYGERGYGGPNPPDGEHTYRFRAYALEDPVELDTSATKADLEEAIEGQVLAEATLEGTYAP